MSVPLSCPTLGHAHARTPIRTTHTWYSCVIYAHEVVNFCTLETPAKRVRGHCIEDINENWFVSTAHCLWMPASLCCAHAARSSPGAPGLWEKTGFQRLVASCPTSHSTFRFALLLFMKSLMLQNGFNGWNDPGHRYQRCVKTSVKNLV